MSLKNGEHAKIVEVQTGDTLSAELPSRDGQKVTIRVLGINCPDTRGGYALANKKLLDEVVTLESDKSFLPILKDQNGNFVAYVRLDDGSDYGEMMISHGFCTDENWSIPHPRAEAYKEARLNHG